MSEESKNHNPSYIPYIGIPGKGNVKEKASVKAIYHRATAPGFFGVIVICFFMPFINIKCNGVTVKTYTGFDIAMGMQRSKSEIQEKFEEKKHTGESDIINKDLIIKSWSAEDEMTEQESGYWNGVYGDATTNPALAQTVTILAIISAFAGFVLSLLKGKPGMLAQIIAGFCGTVMLGILQGLVRTTVPVPYNKDIFANEFSMPMVTTQFAPGYWVAFFLFLAVAILGILRWRFSKKIFTETGEDHHSFTQ